MKAKLTGGQAVAAIFAGIVGHLLFGGGWTLLGLVLFGGVLTGILGLTAGGLAALFGDNPAFADFFDSAGGIVGGVFLGLTIAAFVLMLLGYLVSGWILKGGKVRRPWSTSWWSVFIAALLSLPLLIAYAVISNRGEGGLPFPLVAFLGTVIVGVLIWLWMTWAHRGPAAAAVAPAGPLPEALEGSQAPSSSSTAAAVEPPADPPAKN
jgi:hypothetical protein